MCTFFAHGCYSIRENNESIIFCGTFKCQSHKKNTATKLASRRHKRCRLDPWVRKIPWRRKWQPTLVFLARELHGLRSWVG